MTTLSARDEKIRTREGERLYRSLRRLFAKRFAFEWTTGDTSYTDGKTIWVKYDMQTERHRTFTLPEIRALREAHSIHEAGHVEFDYLPDYTNWLRTNSSSNRSDWTANRKYPVSWTKFFGNMSLDGRMERLVGLKIPAKQTMLDFSNEEWRFGLREEKDERDRLSDFRERYSTRVLGMTDFEGCHEDAATLIDSIQPDIEEIRLSLTTNSCLTAVSELIKKVWPTLLEWMEEDEQNPDDLKEENQSHTQASWADSAEEAEERSKTVVAAPAPESKEEGSFEEELQKIEKQVEKDQLAVEEELEREKPEVIQVSFGGTTEMSDNVRVMQYPRPSQSDYEKTYFKIKRHVKPIARELKQLLQGVPENPRRNVRSGRLMAGQVWRSTRCDDSKVFQKQLKGIPSAEAFIGTMMDVSGSTYSTLPNGEQVIDEMKNGLALLLEAAQLARVPSQAYAFTEEDGTLIFRVKPDPMSFTTADKASLGGLMPLAGNRDTCALQFLLDQMDKRTEEVKVAIMLSDGIPVFEHGEGPETIREMVLQAEKRGVEVLCLFIGDHNESVIETVRSMYPGRMINANKGIARELQKHVKRIIRQRR